MVFTRSQAKLMDDQVEEPKVMKGESNRDAEIVFMDRVVDKMEELASKVALVKTRNVEFQEMHTKLKEEFEDLKI